MNVATQANRPKFLEAIFSREICWFDFRLGDLRIRFLFSKLFHLFINKIIFMTALLLNTVFLKITKFTELETFNIFSGIRSQERRIFFINHLKIHVTLLRFLACLGPTKAWCYVWVWKAACRPTGWDHQDDQWSWSTTGIWSTQTANRNIVL